MPFVDLGFIAGGEGGPEVTILGDTITVYLEKEMLTPCHHAEYEFVIFKGDSKDQAFIVYEGEDRLDLTGAILTFTCKKRATDADALFIHDSDEVGGVEITDAENGEFTVHIDPADTEDAEGEVKYIYDVRANYSGTIITFVRDRLFIKQNVTVYGE